MNLVVASNKRYGEAASNCIAASCVTVSLFQKTYLPAQGPGQTVCMHISNISFFIANVWDFQNGS